jgi:16S rRNA (guanine966-N2)-methyltransferase
MRVVAGNWRGRKLLSPKGDLIRPTTDRVKEAMFSIIGPSIRGSLVLDLCCGAGGLGVEALSRGAKRVIMVDSSRRSLDLSRKNLVHCGAESSSYDLIKADAEVYFNKWNPTSADTSWLLLCDPPYHSSLAAGIVDRLLHRTLHSGFLFGVIEHGDASAFDEVDEGPLHLSNRRYGETCLTVVRPG